MNIAFVNATHRWGGVKSWTLRVAGGLRDRGHGVHLFLRRGDPFAAASRDNGFSTRELYFGFDWNPWTVLTLGRMLRNRNIDAVITNVSKDNRAAGPMARRAGIPILMRVGGPGDLVDRRSIRLEQSRYVTHIVVPATAIKKHLAGFPWLKTPVTVIPNGVDLERFRPGTGAGTLRGELALSPEIPVLVTTGQLTAIKDHDLLIRAFARLDTHSPAPVLVLIGQGEREASLRNLAADLGVSTRVYFPGFRENVHDWVEDADVAVQPSKQEGFPNSVIEFMAKGKALVATRVSGTPEAIDHERDGLLVAPEHESELVDSLNRLISDPALRRRLGASARKKAVERFDQNRMVARVESLLCDLSSGSRVPVP